MHPSTAKYEGIAKFPAVNRDISMVVPKAIMVGQIEHMIAQRGGKILEHFELFDIYEGDQIERGFKSVAYSLTFRSKEKTLEEAEINGAMNKILNGLEGWESSLESKKDENISNSSWRNFMEYSGTAAGKNGYRTERKRYPPCKNHR